MPRLVIENLNKSFCTGKTGPVCAVKNLNLTVADGECLVIVGPSGCGKTTTLRLIAGLETPDAGNISLDDISQNNVPPKDRNVAMVFQHHALFPHLTAYENMAFGLMLRKTPRAEIETRVREAAEILGLTALLKRKPENLSGGECQRVALGRALVRRPKIFLLDEPLSNLDAPMRQQLRGEIQKIRQLTAATMIYVTHDQSEALALADRLAIMRDGTLQQIATPAEILRNPANPFVTEFLGGR